MHHNIILKDPYYDHFQIVIFPQTKTAENYKS